jgi:assimilatory nitrate reductase catalytic subunit
VRGLWIMGANPVVSAPNARDLEARLARLDLLVVADPFLSETAELADVVLPVAQWAEEEGTLTNLEGRVLYRQRAQAPPDGVRTDLDVMKLVATALGRGEHIEARPAAAFEELRRASAGGSADYAGVSYARIIANQGVFWPCPREDGPDTPRLFLERFATPDGRARFFAVEQRDPAEIPDEAYPLFLTTGRLLAHNQSGKNTPPVAELAQAEPASIVEIHPDTALLLGIADGDLVHVVTRRGRAACKARLTATLRRDPMFMPVHFSGDGRANTLTTDVVDPVSKIPAFKLAAARLELAPATPPTS